MSTCVGYQPVMRGLACYTTGLSPTYSRLVIQLPGDTAGSQSTRATIVAPSMLETQMGVLPPAFGLAEPQLLQAFGNKAAHGTGSSFASPSLCHAAF